MRPPAARAAAPESSSCLRSGSLSRAGRDELDDVFRPLVEEIDQG
jgi:hypothetical protein